MSYPLNHELPSGSYGQHRLESQNPVAVTIEQRGEPHRERGPVNRPVENCRKAAHSTCVQMGTDTLAAHGTLNNGILNWGKDRFRHVVQRNVTSGIHGANCRHHRVEAGTISEICFCHDHPIGRCKLGRHLGELFERLQTFEGVEGRHAGSHPDVLFQILIRKDRAEYGSRISQSTGFNNDAFEGRQLAPRPPCQDMQQCLL